MAYKVLVLDDEPIIVEGLTMKLDWGKVGCEIIGSALNGLDGKQLMEELCPDIVISDIMMPGLTGLDLAEYNDRRPKPARFIILTAYSDFAFAQKAIRYRVEDYILKPIDFNKLMDAVTKAANALKESELQRQNMLRLEDEINAAKPLASASLLFSIARYSEGALSEEDDFLNTHLPFQAGVSICAKIYNIKIPMETDFMGHIQKLFINHFQTYGYSLLRGSDDDKLVFLCQLDSAIDIRTSRERILKAARAVAESVADDMHVVCISAVSEAYRSPNELHVRYSENLEQLKQSFFEYQSGVLEVKDMPEGQPEVDLLPVLHHLTHGNDQELADELEHLCKKLQNSRNEESTLHTFRELRHQVTKIASQAGMVNKPQMEQTYGMQNFRFYKKDIQAYLSAICEYIRQGQNQIGKLKLMIEEHYGESGFGLSVAAQKLKVNSSYLSRLFKKETGENFVDFLISYRIEKAKYLLETTKLKNSEIAFRVGFDDERYFGKVFKKRCMITPRQYREEYKNYL